MALIFVMVDGIGLAPAGPQNPVASELSALAGLLGAPLDAALHVDKPGLLARPIDATLGVAGRPQSGSGHTAIYGGYNAPEANGRHQPSYPTIAMRERLGERNLFKLALAAGWRVAWANAYLPGYSEVVEFRRVRHTAGTWAALQAGLALRGLPELLDGRAVSWDITQALARTRPGCGDLPEIAPAAAGARLAHLAMDNDLVAFETYVPDLAAHQRLAWSPAKALRLVDKLVAGIVQAKRPGDTLIVTSDHGNAEDATTRVHTRNPVPLIVIGPAAHLFASVPAIDGLVEAILNGLGEE
jgi:hypothetical protein